MSAPAGQNQSNADAAGASPSEPDVLEVLSGFQASVENLKGLYASRAAASAKLAEREAELAAHADRLKALETELEQRRTAAARDREAMEQLHQQTEKRAEELAAKIAEADRAREGVEKSRAEAERTRAEFEKSRAEIEAARAHVERTRAEADKSREQAEQTKSEADRFRAEVDKSRADVEAARIEAEKSRAEAEAARRQVNELNEELAARQAELEAARNSVEAQRKAVEAAAAEVAAREVSFKTRAAERETSASRAGEIEKSYKEAKAALAAEQARARESEAALRAELAAAVKTRDDLAKRASSGSDSEQRLRTELENAIRKSAALQAVAEEHARQLAAEREEAKRLALELSAVASTSKQTQSSSEADRAKLEKAAKALIELRAERDGLKSELARARTELTRAVESATKGRPAAPNDAATLLRRKRVARYRQLVKEQSEKVKKATETLRSRFEAAEQLVAQRAELAEAHAAIKANERRAEKSKSKGRVAATMFYGLASALVLAFMCWIGTGLIAPGSYIATATIGAESRTRDLTDAERAEWQAFHEQILADPQFHEITAERMGRQALVAYSNAGAVRELIKSTVKTHSAEDGQLVIELQGDGPDRPKRVLDTLVTALASHANSSRHKRVDGATTAIRQPATVSDQPVDNQRLVFAGLAWAVSLMLGMGVAAVLWRRMLHAKSTFERATRVDEVLDESRWQPLPTTSTGRKGRSRMGF